MKTRNFLLILLFLSGYVLHAQTDKLKQLDEYIQNSMADWEMPGFAVSIVKDDSVIFAKGYGVREFGKDEKVDQNTLFVIASCSKAFTTAALAILVDRGKINWDDKVIDYLPDFQMYDPWVTNEITIRDLVTHRSGLATFSGDFLWLGSNYDRKEVVRRARRLKPVSSFRSKYGYQNIMFITAAEIIKAVTDTSWGDFIKEHFLLPLKMVNTNTSYKELAVSENKARAHYKKDGEIKVYTDIQKDNASGALGINSSVNDLAQWIRLQLNRGKIDSLVIFSEEQSKEMWSNQTAFGEMNYGLGWFIRYRNGKRMLYHGGGMPGMISTVALIPEENVGFAVLSNMETGMVSAIRDYIVDLFTGAEPKDYNKIMIEKWNERLQKYEDELKRREEVRVKNTSPSLPLEKYCGKYEDKMYGEAEVSMKDGKLFLQFIPTPTFRGVLNHYHYDTFFIDWKDEFLTRGWIKFDMDFEGNVKRFTLEVPNSPDFIFTELLFEKKN
ncbi:MAG: serine hydrolase [Melioribacter sp.]|uniref:serine hydrolase n=1 Tax=Melioribacter sp. TaxID=2052167 RepID=UPI003BD9B095